MKLLIQNGRVLDPVSKTVTLTDLLAENGRVALLGRVWRRRRTGSSTPQGWW